ncbi:hypothetical protein J4558_26100 [Leptolyngbya sp. 15MV]|nr:hypothetical protein J4558_26100 [Leptolyngbya sp. 15MV]
MVERRLIQQAQLNGHAAIVLGTPHPAARGAGIAEIRLRASRAARRPCAAKWRSAAWSRRSSLVPQLSLAAHGTGRRWSARAMGERAGVRAAAKWSVMPG